MKNFLVFILSMLFYCFTTMAFASSCIIPITVDTIKLTFDDCKPSIYKVDNECFLRRQFLTKTVIVQGDACSHSNLKWKVLVDNWADSLVEYEFNSELTVGDDISNVNNNTWENIKDDNNNGIPDIYLKPNEKNTSASIVLIDIEGKRSKHVITWIVTDECGNSAKCQEVIEVRDTKAPTPVCVPLIVGVLSDPDSSGPLEPGIEIWANDFINKSYDNCAPENMLLHTFDNISPQNGNKVLPGNAPNVININVDHYFDASGGLAPYPIRPNNDADRMVVLRYLKGEDGIQKWMASNRTSSTYITSKTYSCTSYKVDADIKVTVWDAMMNNDYCWTTLSFQLPTICDFPEEFRGKIVSFKNSPVDNVKISLDNLKCPYTNLAKTNFNGEYYIYTNLNLEYKIEASYDFQPMKGLDQNDLLTIWAHVQGARLITNPYKMKAADINDDGEVTLSDALLLEKALKSQIEEGFGPSMVVYSDTLVNLENWHHKISSSKIDTTNWFRMTNDFIAIKKGDINGSYFDTIPNEFTIPNYNSDDIKISPNPYSDYSIVSYASEIVQDMEMSVYDYTGKLVFTNVLPSSTGLNYTILNASQIEKAGVYILEIVGRNSRLSSKLVKID